MSGRLRPLDMILRAVDEATGPLARVNERIEQMNAPVRQLGGAFNRLAQEARLPQVADAVKGVGRAVGDLAKRGAALALGGGILGVGVIEGFRRFLEYTSHLSAVSQQLKVSAADMQVFHVAAKQIADIEPGQFDASVKVFSRVLTDIAANRGPAAAVAHRLEQISGIKIFDPKKPNDMVAALRRTMDAMKQVQNPLVAMRMATILTGRANEEMVTFLQAGSGALDEWGARARAAGQILGDDVVNRGDAVGDKIDFMTGTLSKLAYTIMGDLLPAIEPLLDEMEDGIEKNRDWIRNDLGPKLAELIRAIPGLVKSVKEGIDSIGGFRNAAIAAAIVLSSDLILAVGNLAWVLGGVAVRGILLAADGIGLLSGVMVKAAGFAIPALLTGVRAITAAFAASPWGAALVAVSLLIAAGPLLYQKFKPFRDMIDGLVEAFEYAGNWWNSWLNGESSSGSSAAAGGPTPAQVGAGPRTQVGGRVEVLVSAARGSQAQVMSTQSVNQSVPLDSGQLMSMAY